MSLPETCSDPAAAKAAENSALQLGQCAQAATEETRRFFWPDEAGGAVVRQINQRRWSPCDAQAWDAFVADRVGFMEIRLQTIAPLIDQLQLTENLVTAGTNLKGTEQAQQIGQYIPRESYHRLTAPLTQAGLDATLKAP